MNFLEENLTNQFSYLPCFIPKVYSDTYLNSVVYLYGQTLTTASYILGVFLDQKQKSQIQSGKSFIRFLSSKKCID